MKTLKKILAGITSFLLVSSGIAFIATPAYAADGVIPDPNLAACFNEALGRDQNTPITETDVSSYTGDLVCTSRDITDLTGLEYLTEVSYLGLSGNENLTDITPLSGIETISQLNISSTGVSDLSPLTDVDIRANVYLTDTPISDVSPLAGKTFGVLDISGTNVSDISSLYGSPIWFLKLPYSVNNYENLTEFPNLSYLAVGSLDMTNYWQINANIENLVNLEIGSLDIPDYSYLSSVIHQLRYLNILSTVGNLTDIYNLEYTGINTSPTTEANISISSFTTVNATFDDSGVLNVDVSIPQPILDGGLDSLLLEANFPYESVSYDLGTLTFTGVDGNSLSGAEIYFGFNPEASPYGTNNNPWEAYENREYPTNLYMNITYSLNVTDVTPPVDDTTKTLMWWSDNYDDYTTSPATGSINVGADSGVTLGVTKYFSVVSDTTGPASCANPRIEGENAEAFTFMQFNNQTELYVESIQMMSLETGEYTYTIFCDDPGMENQSLTLVLDILNIVPLAPVGIEMVECPVITYTIDGNDVTAQFYFEAVAEDKGNDVDYVSPMGFYETVEITDNVTGSVYVSEEEYYETDAWLDPNVKVADGLRTFSVKEPFTVKFPGAAEAFNHEEYNVTISSSVWVPTAYYLSNNAWYPEINALYQVGCVFDASVSQPEPPVIDNPTDDTPTDEPVKNTPKTPLKNGGADVEPIVFLVIGGVVLLIGAGGAGLVLYRRKLNNQSDN